MEYPPQGRQIVRFGVFDVDLKAGELHKHGLKIPLQEQPFRLLALLLERHGEVVSREELRQALWPEDTFVDFERGLNTAVKKLRRALSDAAEQPRYIATHYKRGYRFIAPVEDQNQTAPRDPPAEGAPLRRQRLALLVAASATVVVLIAVVTSWWQSLATSPSSTATPVPLTSYPGSERQASFSPDGSQVAFSWNGPKEDNYDIYIKAIGSEAYLRLTNDPEDDLFPAWSPDGRYIAFLRVSELSLFNTTKGEILLVPALGGPEQQVARVLVRGPMRWLSDSEWLVCSDRATVDDLVGLFLIAVPSGQKRRLTSPSSNTEWDLFPAVSPDGRMIVFRRGGISSNLFLLRLSEGLQPVAEPRRLAAEPDLFYQPAWTSNGQEIVFPIWAIGVTSLWKMKITPENAGFRQPERLEWSAEGAEHPAISRWLRGRGGLSYQRLAYTKSFTNSNIYRIDIPAEGSRPGRPVPVIASTLDDAKPQYSPDGRRISFVSQRSGRSELWVANFDGSQAAQLTRMGVGGCPRWSPDGERILFDSLAAGHLDMYIVNTRGGQPRRLTVSESQDGVGSWSHDGERIYFGSNRTGRWEIWKMRVDGTATTQITKHGGRAALESPDGRWIYYTRLRFDTSLWRVPVNGGEETKILGSVPWLSFDLTREGIYFVHSNHPDADSSIRFFRFEDETVRQIATIQGRMGSGLSVSPDGRSILFTQTDYLGSDLMLVDDFR